MSNKILDRNEESNIENRVNTRVSHAHIFGQSKNTVSLESSHVPSQCIQSSYTDSYFQLKKKIKNGLAISLNEVESDNDIRSILTFRLSEKPPISEHKLVVQSQYGKLLLSESSLFLQTLTGIMFNVSDPDDQELLSVALARLPKRFVDLFGFLALVESDSLVNKVKPNNIKNNPFIEPSNETLPEDSTHFSDALETHCVSVSLTGKDISLHCFIEAGTDCWLNIFKSSEFTPIIQRSTHNDSVAQFKERIPVVVGNVSLNRSMLMSLNKGDIIFLDQSETDELGNLNLNISTNKYKIQPVDSNLNAFKLIETVESSD